MLKCLIALTTLFPAVVLAATVWTWVDEQGRRHYSDREVPGATRIEIAGVQTFSGSAAASSGRASNTPAGAPVSAAPYSVLDVISPAPEQTFWNIGGNLTVRLAINPALRAEHRVDVILDGRHIEIGARSLDITIPDVFRGEHTLQAMIVDSESEEVALSDPVTFYVQQTSIQRQQTVVPN